MYMSSVIVGAFIALFVGGLLVRSGRTGVAKTYVITTVVLLIASVLNLGGLISVEVAHAVLQATCKVKSITVSKCP